MHQPLNRSSLFGTQSLFSPKADAPAKREATKADADFIVHVWSQWNDRAAQFSRTAKNAGSTLFQGELWLSTWYETLAQGSNVEALIVGFENRKTGKLFMLFPLCRHMENGLRVIGFADLGLADYNAPIIQPEQYPALYDSAKIMQALCKALPFADLLKLEKSPEHLNGHINPLTSLEGLQESNLCHYGIEITTDWSTYWSTLKRNFRKDQRRRWRVLEKKGEVSFLRCRDEKQLMPLFEIMLDQQQERLERLGLTQLLANKTMKEFYTRLIQKGCQNGPVIFTALLVDDLPIATLLGFGDGQQYAMTLSGQEMGEWSKCSPGRLLTERTMHMLHEEGYTYFDFTIGDEPYKKYFAKKHGPLLEFYHPLSWKGLPHFSWMTLKAAQRQSEFADKIKKMVLGR